MTDTMYLFFRHADSESLFENWSNASKTSKQPAPVVELTGVSNYELDKYMPFTAMNPQSALGYYVSNSEALGTLAEGENFKEYIWCEYKSHMFLFAVIEASAGYDSGNDSYTFTTRCHWNGQWIAHIDKLAGDTDE